MPATKAIVKTPVCFCKTGVYLVFLIFVMLFAAGCVQHAPRMTSEGIPQLKYEYQIPDRLDDGWPVSSLEAEKINPEKIKKLIHNILNENFKGTQSLLIIKNKKLVLEEYFYKNDKNTKQKTASVTKSITSVLIGICLDKNLIRGVDIDISDLFSDYKGTKWIDKKYDIKLKDVLTMTSGLAWKENDNPGSSFNDQKTIYQQPSPVKYLFNREKKEPAGERFVYNTGLSILLGEVIKKVSGLTADKFARQFLFEPLGISDFEWMTYQNGTVDTGGGLKLRARDMAKIGYLMLNKGKWGKKQLVSQGWIKQSLQSHIEQKEAFVSASDYGYQWHLGQKLFGDNYINAFFAVGKGGQYIFGFPSLDMIVVITSRYSDAWGIIYGQAMMSSYILPAVLPEFPELKAKNISRSRMKDYTGVYEIKNRWFKKVVVKDKSHMYFIDQHGKKEMLWPMGKDRFVLRSNRFGKLQVVFKRDNKEKISFLDIYYGFTRYRLNKRQ